ACATLAAVPDGTTRAVPWLRACRRRLFVSSTPRSQPSATPTLLPRPGPAAAPHPGVPSPEIGPATPQWITSVERSTSTRRAFANGGPAPVRRASTVVRRWRSRCRGKPATDPNTVAGGTTSIWPRDRRAAAETRPLQLNPPPAAPRPASDPPNGGTREYR